VTVGSGASPVDGAVVTGLAAVLGAATGVPPPPHPASSRTAATAAAVAVRFTPRG
jgi:hypothetical protein